MQIVRRSSLLFHLLMAVIVGGGVAVVMARELPYGGWAGVPAAQLVLWIGMRKSIRRWRSARVPLSASERQWLRDHVSFYCDLPSNERGRFERDVRFVLDEWRFEGVAGVAATAELRVAVAAGVALLMHGRPEWELPATRTVLFYPDAFDEVYEGGETADFDGMAHQQGPVILSKKAVEESWANPRDGNNVVLHELAHLFDFANAFADGIPSLLDPSSRSAWEELARLEMRRALLGRSMLRRYAATNSAEFFAVAVENFFERPDQMARQHHRLFEALVALFNLDPRPAQEVGETAAE
ncbi:MAG TPA: M90 family metallopeptidase [Rhodothermales bacterium]|nr:M90 family metallopeptidase [Rhodothermales bacterium]